MNSGLSRNLEIILDPSTIRERTLRIFENAKKGGTSFNLDLDKLPACVDFVMEVTTRCYPDGKIPYHGRFEHFRVGGIDRVEKLCMKLDEKFHAMDPVEKARALIDVTLVSVLLDAGAGNIWKYTEDGVIYTRSEGLALASLAMFEHGAFSDDKSNPYKVTASRLKLIREDDVVRGFKVSLSNPLLGLEGRASLLKHLGESLAAYKVFFGADDHRPGNMIDYLLSHADTDVKSKKKRIKAQDILKLLLIGLSKMWPARSTVDGIGFGDVWHYRGTDFEHLIPFHKLSQWLTYSLIEPIESVGIEVTGVDDLTGLPEYRNGGLFLDFGVLKLRDENQVRHVHDAGSDLIIEWRALTVQLLDLVGDEVRKKLSKTKEELPLARILQGGTWSAGREIAKKMRDGGGPPLNLKSDGMVF